MSQDFIEADPFDTETIEREAAKLAAEEDKPVDQAREIITRRMVAYACVFTEGARTQDDIDIVLNDLQWFCRVWQPSYDIRDGQHAENLARQKDGRREVFLRIKDFSRLDSDTLMLKYAGALK